MIVGDLLGKAMKFGFEKHQGQFDDNGQNYFLTHCVPVAQILAIVTDNESVVAAGVLHDIIEDTDVTYEDLVKEFNKEIADLVMEVTHEGTNDNHGYYFPRLETRNGILIKFADRLSNLSRMQSWPTKRKEQYLRKSKFWRSG